MEVTRDDAEDGVWVITDIHNGLMEETNARFDSSFDWIMPVVEKLNEYGVWTIRPGYVRFESSKGELLKKRKFLYHTAQMDWETEDDEPVTFVFLIWSVVVSAILRYNTHINSPENHKKP